MEYNNAIHDQALLFEYLGEKGDYGVKDERGGKDEKDEKGGNDRPVYETHKAELARLTAQREVHVNQLTQLAISRMIAYEEALLAYETAKEVTPLLTERLEMFTKMRDNGGISKLDFLNQQLSLNQEIHGLYTATVALVNVVSELGMLEVGVSVSR